MQSRETFHSQRILPNRFYRRSRKEFCFLKLLVPVGKSPLSSCFFSPQRQKKKWICPSAHESQCVRSVSGQALLLRDALSLELLQHVVQVAGVRVAVARQVGAKLGLVVHLVPDYRVRLAGGAGRTHGENESAVPRHQKEPQYLGGRDEGRHDASSQNPVTSTLILTQIGRFACGDEFSLYLASLLAVGEVAVSGEPAGGERFARTWVLWALKVERKVHQVIRAKSNIASEGTARAGVCETLPGCQEGCYK